MATIEDVTHLVSEYNPTADLQLLQTAYGFAENAHTHQTRLSGEAYITHPVEIAYILAGLKMDMPTIIAGLLHDVVEDTNYTYKDIEDNFGKEVADLVDGVTKITKLEYSNKEDQQAESFRKMFIAMANDLRVIIIKLADRLHNMRTLSAMSKEKQISKATETLDIYAPIAHRLGIFKIKWEFEDLALRYLEPEQYYQLVEKVAQKRQEREAYIGNVVDVLSDKLTKESIKFSIEGRPKHFFSIFKKMQNGKNFSEIYDLIAIRVLVDSVNDCYAVLGWVHTLWKPIPGRIKDYIAMPKPNMYQSLHTTVIGPGGSPVEIQIRTKDMHQIAEYGIAAHWKYKEGKQGSDEMSERLRWLWELKELDQELQDSDEFMDAVKKDLYTDEVFVFTPKGKVIELPMGATPLDFAYRIHSDVGNKCVGAKVNGKIIPLNAKLKTGDIVEVITNPASKGPSRDWLKVVVSTHAKNKIRSHFRKTDKEENVQKGKDMLEREIKHAKLNMNDIIRNEYADFIFKRFNITSWEDLYSSIGYGGIRAGYVIQRVKENFKQDFPEEETVVPIISAPKHGDKGRTVNVQGHNDLSVKFAKCCMPVPGDNIMGYITRGRGISVHRADCINIKSTNDTERLIEVSWISESPISEKFSAEIVIKASDRKGLLSDISTTISNEGISITGMTVKTQKDGSAFMNMDVIIQNTKQVDKLLGKISVINGVNSVYRL